MGTRPRSRERAKPAKTAAVMWVGGRRRQRCAPLRGAQAGGRRPRRPETAATLAVDGRGTGGRGYPGYICGGSYRRVAEQISEIREIDVHDGPFVFLESEKIQVQT